MNNLPKIFWVVLIFTAVLWVGVGIYYLKSRPSQAPAVPPPQMTAIPSPQLTKPVVADEFAEVEFIVGNFQGWEEIEGSPDRYILLIDPETGKAFPQIRVGLEESTLFGAGEREDATVFAVTKDGEDYEVLGYFKDFSFEEIAKLIKKGDYVKVVLKKKIIEETDEPLQYLSTKNAKDEAGNLLAHWFFIKRAGGKQEIEQELGRKN